MKNSGKSTGIQKTESQTNIKGANDRVFSFDFIKMLAYFGVIMIHCAMYWSFTLNMDSKSWMMVNIFDAIARYSIPCFIMVTGALSLDENKKISIKTCWKHYILRFLIILVFWEALYAEIYLFYAGENPFSFNVIAENILSSKYLDWDCLWYLYFLIGFYLVLPAIKLFVKKENKNVILYLIIIGLAFQIIPKTFDLFVKLPIMDVQTFTGKFKITMPTAFLTFILLGWYLYNFPPKKPIRIAIYIFGILAVALIPVSLSITQDQSFKIFRVLFGDDSILIYLYGSAFFLFWTTVLRNKKSSKAFANVTKASFGIFLSHMIFLQIFSRLFITQGATGTEILVQLLLVFVTTSASSFVFSYILSKIPGVRYLISR